MFRVKSAGLTCRGHNFSTFCLIACAIIDDSVSAIPLTLELCPVIYPPCFDMAKLTVRDLDLHGKRVLMRVDYNVPMEEKDGQMVINDVTRIKETLPTLELLVKQGAKTILTAHLGRPEGKREPWDLMSPTSPAMRHGAGAAREIAGEVCEIATGRRSRPEG